MKLPTDRHILECIYAMYEKDYPGSPKLDGTGYENDPYLPIDLEAVAAKAGVSPRLLFGRLYYDLDNRHGYKRDNLSTHLFAAKAGDRMHCVHFPYLAAILAGLNHELRHRLFAYSISGFAVLVAVASLAVNLLSKHP